MKRYRTAAIAAIMAAAGACSGDKSGGVSRPEPEAPWAPAKLTSVKGVPATEIEAALKKKLAGSPPAKIDDEQWARTKRLYRAFGDNPLWLSSDGLHSDRAFALANAVLQVEQDGMRMDAYPVGPLAQAMIGVTQNKNPTADLLADADLILSAAFAALGEDYLTGQVDPKAVAQNWHIDPEDEQVDSALVRAMRISALDKAIATMRPQDPDYASLRKALDQFQQIVVKGGWKGVPEGEAVKPGERMSAMRIAALRARLAAEGFSAAGDSTGGAVYDHALAGAVANFQAHHGIVVDSMLGKETVDALNQSAPYRAAQIAANLERLRWLPRNFGSRYIYVNVPAFRLDAYDKGEKALSMKVIVGEDFEDKATPVFSDVMETVVFRRYWNVTHDIAAKEIFQKIRSNPGSLASIE
jgi:murein L,D-transpeptidase YcbB/YkuD